MWQHHSIYIINSAVHYQGPPECSTHYSLKPSVVTFTLTPETLTHLHIFAVCSPSLLIFSTT